MDPVSIPSDEAARTTSASAPLEEATIPIGGTRRGWEIGVAVAFVVLALVVVVESIRLGAGYTFAGPEPGFFPFWAAVPLVVTAGIGLWQSFRLPGGMPIFESSEEVGDLLKVGIPLAGALIGMAWLGFYLATAAYVGFFTAWYGRYPWWAVMAAAVLSPVIFYLVFEQAFTIPLPKSIFYRPGIPF
jgi:putative tricarboxylic transport membrane protein